MEITKVIIIQCSFLYKDDTDAILHAQYAHKSFDVTCQKEPKAMKTYCRSSPTGMFLIKNIGTT